MGVLELADDLWTGRIATADHHPLQRVSEPEEVADGVHFMSVMSNVTLVDAGDELALVDTGTQFTAEHVHAQVRAISGAPLRAAVFSHGHTDHVFGVGPFDNEAEQNGRARPEVFGHEAMPARFDRYRLTAVTTTPSIDVSSGSLACNGRPSIGSRTPPTGTEPPSRSAT